MYVLQVSVWPLYKNEALVIFVAHVHSDFWLALYF